MMQKMNFSITYRDYIDLLQPHCTHGAIFTSEGEIYSASDGWTITSEDCQKFSGFFNNNPSETMKMKFRFGQHRYLVVYADETQIVGRNFEFGIIILKCKTCFLLGYFDGSVEPKKCLQSLHRVSKFMMNNIGET